MGLSGRSNSDAEILRVGVPGTGLGTVAGEGQRLSKMVRVGRVFEMGVGRRSVEDRWVRC